MSQPISTPGRELTERQTTVSRLPQPDLPTMDEYLRLAWNGLSATTPAARRVEAVESGRDLLAWLIGLPLDEMDTDSLVHALLYLRAGLARMVVATIPTAVPPVPDPGPALDDADLVAHLMDLISDAAPCRPTSPYTSPSPCPPTSSPRWPGPSTPPGCGRPAPTWRPPASAAAPPSTSPR